MSRAGEAERGGALQLPSARPSRLRRCCRVRVGCAKARLTCVVAFVPDLRWVASAGEDDTLRLWPMPDLSKPPLHTLPHGELLAKLHSLTNLSAVRDPASSTGWTIETGPFPGWRDVPTW